MTFISYAQNLEDVMLYRALKEVNKGFYIDVGAQDPVFDSVTNAFYERGWRGINIEPLQQWFDRLTAYRPDDINLQLAASSKDGSIRFFEVTGTALSTCDEAIARRHESQGRPVHERTVPAKRLDEICKENSVKEVHFLKIDVEGAEGTVLEGIDLERIRPWIILVESTEPNSPVTTHHNWENLLTSRRYEFVYFDGLNRFYIPEEQTNLRAAFSVPPNFFDSYVRYSEHLALSRAQELEAKLCSIYASRSWRVTAPLRQMLAALKRGIGTIRNPKQS